MQSERFDSNFVLPEFKLAVFCIPKNAATSMKAAFLDALGEKYIGSNVPLPGGGVEEVPAGVPNHERLPRITADEIWSKYPNFRKVMICRNPWDRLLSCWAQKVVKRMGAGEFRGFDQFGVKPDTTFKRFVEIVADVPDEQSNIHFASQTHLAGLTGGWENIPFKAGFMVLRFETVAYDWQYLQSWMWAGAPSLILPPLARWTTSDHPHYSEMCDTVTRQMVAERYAADIQEFNYSF